MKKIVIKSSILASPIYKELNIHYSSKVLFHSFALYSSIQYIDVVYTMASLAEAIQNNDKATEASMRIKMQKFVTIANNEDNKLIEACLYC